MSDVSDVLAPYLSREAAELHRLDPMVRGDLPDAVHQMRVTARRLRAVLLGFDREFLAGHTAGLRKDLGWLAAELGRARDLEVLRKRISTTALREGVVLTELDAQLAESHEHAHADAVTAMASARYAALLEELDAFVAAPPWSQQAHRPASEELRHRLRRLWRQLDAAAGELEDADNSEGQDSNNASERALSLHDLRRRAKRLRYCTEAAEPALGASAGELSRMLAELQDRLGRHHDAVLADRMITMLGDPDLAPAANATRRRLAREASDDDRRALHMVRKIRRSRVLHCLR